MGGMDFRSKWYFRVFGESLLGGRGSGPGKTKKEIRGWGLGAGKGYKEATGEPTREMRLVCSCLSSLNSHCFWLKTLSEAIFDSGFHLDVSACQSRTAAHEAREIIYLFFSKAPLK